MAAPNVCGKFLSGGIAPRQGLPARPGAQRPSFFVPFMWMLHHVSAVPHPPLTIQPARQKLLLVLVIRDGHLVRMLRFFSFATPCAPCPSLGRSPESFGASITPMESLWLKVISQWVCLLLQVRALGDVCVMRQTTLARCGRLDPWGCSNALVVS